MPATLRAQEVVQALPGTTDADRLAEQMRALASNPRDLHALIAAGDLSLSLGDLSGAASLYARAEKVSANDPRIKAGEGAILVRSERPGEALRYFAQAEAGGYDARGFAADRGLAYDLIGQQERAQRDYRTALKTRPDDEVVKRYALSLGISGKRDAALEQLDPLLRKTDRSAWRIRAFILAMAGDQPGAEKIATTMLPAGMAQGLLPFFQRLPSLPATDRAFAVHFGEVRATPERLADARLAPSLPQLAAEPAPVALAAVQPGGGVTRPDRRGRTRGRRDAMLAPAVSVAATQPQPVAPSYPSAAAALARVQPLPSVPTTLASAAPTKLLGALPTTAASSASVMSTVRPAATPPVSLAATGIADRRTPTTTGAAPSVSIAAVASAPPATVSNAQAANLAVSRPPVPASLTAANAVTVAAPVPLATAEPLPRASVAPTPGFTTSAVAPAPAVTLASATATLSSAAVPAAATVAASAAVPANFSAQPSREEADSVLARIVAGLSIPAAELGVAPPIRAVAAATEPAPDTAARVIAEARAKEERDAAAQKALALKTAADKRAADRKAIADKKALAAKKLADEKKIADAAAAAEEKKAAAGEKKAARANPERIWVQVAGGANANDLPKAYAAVKAKASAVFGSRTAWSTPLRATNRVLAGPFKTDAEARTFVNQLAKAGVSAFTFTSDAGQAVTKLPPK